MKELIWRVAILFLLLSCTPEKELDAGTETTTEECDAGVDAGTDSNIEESNSLERQKSTQIDEVVWAWNTIFDDVGTSQYDKRRKRFHKYAEMLINNIYMYQNEKLIKYNGERLPKIEYLHILLASMIYKEASVIPTIVGRSNKEVGFFQLHSKALQGYSPKTVRYNTELGISLGLKWFGRAIRVCNADIDNINDLNSLSGSLAVFGAGEKKATTRGKCETNWKFAKERISLANNLIARMLAEQE